MVRASWRFCLCEKQEQTLFEGYEYRKKNWGKKEKSNRKVAKQRKKI